MEREYVLHVPDAYDPGTPVPLLLVFHGYTMNASDQEADSRLAQLGEVENFITVYPQGRGNWQRWLFSLDSVEIDISPSSPDMVFVDHLLDQLTGELAIDRVFTLGFSNGGWMASAVACTFPDRVDAVAVVAGIMDFGDDCRRSVAVPLITLHGISDTYEPFAGGVENAPDRGMLPTDASGTLDDLPVSDNAILETGVVEKVERWAEINGCADGAALEQTDAFTSWVYDCPTGAAVILYEIDGGQHAWTIESDVDTNETVWAFLSSQAAAP